MVVDAVGVELGLLFERWRQTVPGAAGRDGLEFGAGAGHDDPQLSCRDRLEGVHAPGADGPIVGAGLPVCKDGVLRDALASDSHTSRGSTVTGSGNLAVHSPTAVPGDRLI